MQNFVDLRFFFIFFLKLTEYRQFIKKVMYIFAEFFLESF